MVRPLYLTVQKEMENDAVAGSRGEGKPDLKQDLECVDRIPRKPPPVHFRGFPVRRSSWMPVLHVAMDMEGGGAYVRGSGCTRDVCAMYAAIKSDVRADIVRI